MAKEDSDAKQKTAAVAQEDDEPDEW